jgi:hypothetical protein
MSASTAKLIAAMTAAYGRPVSTPAWVTGLDGRLERSKYRVFKWPCGACGAGANDWLYRPCTVDSDGDVWCSANGCSPEEIGAAVNRELRLLELLDRRGRLLNSLRGAA